MAGVPKHNLAEFESGPGANDLAFKSFFNHFRNQCGMVHMGMGQQDILKGLGLIFFSKIIPFFDLLVSLKHSAINQESPVGMFQKKTGTGYCSGCSPKRDRKSTRLNSSHGYIS